MDFDPRRSSVGSRDDFLLHDGDDFPVQASAHVGKRIVLNVHALAQLARPFAAGELTGGVRVLAGGAVERHLYVAGLRVASIPQRS